jgi:hypothetical protein
MLKVNSRLRSDIDEPESRPATTRRTQAMWHRLQPVSISPASRIQQLPSANLKWRRPRESRSASTRQKIPPPHGKVTRPLRIAYTTNSAVL